ncbi:hypothetical protein L1049_025151 [Liquidambar formosana]|uniref:Phospholipase-like protein (PEARLI 4) family protein n=1 Tax=Liquidambar formosana TaxID=63359 RepID=A0AAP0S2L3_LIQFO
MASEGRKGRDKGEYMDGEDQSGEEPQESSHLTPANPRHEVFSWLDYPSVASKYSSQHAQTVIHPCGTLRPAKRVKDMENPSDSPVAIMVDRTIPTSEKPTSRLTSRTQGSEEHHSATVLSAHLQTLSAQMDSRPSPSRYSLRPAKMVYQSRSTLRRSERIRRIEDSNKNMLAETVDGFVPLSTLPPQSPGSDEHQLAAPPSAPISAEINNHLPTGLAPSASANNVSEQTPLREATVASNNVEDRVEENAINTNQTDEHLSRSFSFILSEMADLLDDGSSSHNEVEFQGLKIPLVTVNGYRVKEEVAPALRSIFLKHGDIAANCSFQTMQPRSSILEIVCGIILKLQESEFTQITPVELNTMRAIVSDLEGVRLDVRWLCQRLDDIIEAKQLVKHSSTMKKAKGRNKQVIEETEKELKKLEVDMEDLVKKISLTNEKLDAMKAEAVVLNETTSDAKTKVGRFYRRSLVDGVV